MRYWPVFLSLLVGSERVPDSVPDNMAFMFGSYWSSPVVVTHFAMEGPLGEIHPEIAGGRADGYGPRSGGAALVSAPGDVGRDGLWRLSAQWVELPTDKAWRAEVDIPIE